VGFTPPRRTGGGLADGAAGVAAQRDLAKPAATAAALPPLLPPGTRLVSCGLRVGPNAEFSVLLPIANSSRLVLPTTMAPAVAQRVDDGGVVRRLPAVEDLRRAGGGHAAGAHVVLQRDGDTGQRAGVVAGGDVGVDGRGALAGLLGQHQVERVDLGLASGDGGEVLLDDVGGLGGAGAHGGSDLRRGSGRVRRPSALTTDRRHAEEPVLARGGRRGQHLVAVEARLHDVGAQHVDQRERLGHRHDVGQIEGIDVGEVLEHAVELRRHAIDLFGGDVEAGQPGHLGHISGRKCVQTLWGLGCRR
jgi:hypothetical protein